MITADWPSGARPRFVGSRLVDQGALLSPNQPILTVAELDPLRAVIYVIERYYPYVKAGQEAQLTHRRLSGEQIQRQGRPHCTAA